MTDPAAERAGIFHGALYRRGFGRGTHVRLSQRRGSNCMESRLRRRSREASPDSGSIGNPKRLPYDSAPCSGFDPNRPILIESVEYTLWVRELGRLIRVYEGLSLVPEHRRYGPLLLPRW